MHLVSEWFRCKAVPLEVPDTFILLCTHLISFVQLTRLHVTHGGLGSQSHLGQPSQDLSACAAGIRCPAFHLFDVGTFLATLTFGMHQTGWFGGFVNCATSVCFGYHIGPAEC